MLSICTGCNNGYLNEFLRSGILNGNPHLFLELFARLGEFHINNKNFAVLLFPIDGYNDWLSSDQPSRLRNVEDSRRTVAVNGHLRRYV